MHSSVILACLYVYGGYPGVHNSDVTILNAGRTEASWHPVQETSLVPACANPACRQDLAARGAKKQEGPKPVRVAQFKKAVWDICSSQVGKPEMGGTGF